MKNRIMLELSDEHIDAFIRYANNAEICDCVIDTASPLPHDMVISMADKSLASIKAIQQQLQQFRGRK